MDLTYYYVNSYAGRSCGGSLVEVGRSLVEAGRRFLRLLPALNNCDIYTYARSPELVAPSNYLGIPCAFMVFYDWRSVKSAEFAFYEKCCVEIHELAKEAIRLRADGYRRYIKWFINRLNELASVFVGSMFENDTNELEIVYGVVEGRS